jgi:GNAT superfamily N-acetyltransferase
LATIIKATTDAEILATRDLMCDLRPNLQPDSYLSTVRRLMQTNGYNLASLVDEGAVRAVAGYRFMEMLYCGSILYVDDLITDERLRSKGFGKSMMDWLKEEARAKNCDQLHLDSGVQRENTHRFYFRERLTINCYHFRVTL